MSDTTEVRTGANGAGTAARGGGSGVTGRINLTDGEGGAEDGVECGLRGIEVAQLWGLYQMSFIITCLYWAFTAMDWLRIEYLPKLEGPLARQPLVADPTSCLWTCLLIRGAVTAVLVAYTGLLYRALRRRAYCGKQDFKDLYSSGMVVILIVGLSISLISRIIDAYDSNYHTGLVFMFLLIAGFSPYRQFVTVLLLMTLGLGYFVPAILRYNAEQWRTSPMPFSMASSVLLALTAAVLCAYMHSCLRRSHASRCEEVVDSRLPPALPEDTPYGVTSALKEAFGFGTLMQVMAFVVPVLSGIVGVVEVVKFLSRK